MQAPEVIMSPANAGSRPGHFDEPTARKLTVTIPVLPAFVRRGFSKTQGLILMVLALLGGVALATWTISDPSLTFANGSEAENWLGFWGASFADFTMQFLGFAAIALLLPPMIWGIQKFALRPISHLAPRMGYWIGGLVFLATALACLPMPSDRKSVV